MIWDLISGLVPNLWGYLAAAGAAIAAIAGLYLKIRSGDKAKDKLKDAKETIKAHEVRDDVEDRIDRGGSAKQRLRERWRKP